MIHEVPMPALSSTMESGKIVTWLKQVGERVEKGENLLVVESDKADMDVESFHSGILAAIVVEAGGSANVGSPVAILAETEAELAEAQAKAAALKTPAAPKPSPAPVPQPSSAPVRAAVPAPKPSSDRILASPLAKRRAAELGVDLSKVVGSGPGGRIVEADVEKAAQAAHSTPVPPPQPPQPIVSSPTPQTTSGDRIVPLTTLQQAVVRNMNASLSVPVFHVGYTITTTALDSLYKDVKSKGVTMTALLVKAVGLALAKHPLLNAAYSDSGIRYNPAINIAVAVAMEDGGLITPVLTHVDRSDLYELSRRWKDLVERARRKQLQPEEYTSGTFTLSNLGMFGVDRFDAILPPGQGGILAIAASRPTVVALEGGAIAVRNQMQVNLTADHRIIYGADAAAFLQTLAQILEQDPGSLLR
ncbi:MAG: dihydrolipoamide acetyltransferase family protein [Thermostichales cyanobacterium DRC_bins_46]